MYPLPTLRGCRWQHLSGVEMLRTTRPDRFQGVSVILALLLFVGCAHVCMLMSYAYPWVVNVAQLLQQYEYEYDTEEITSRSALV